MADVSHHDNNAASADIDLYALSDAQLEEICTVRGFELVHDDETFTHDDYVEAARQCLAIEEDMHDILQEHPEILEELEQEREYMMHEKERLEQELLKEAEKRADGRQHYPNETEQEQEQEEEEEAHEVVDLDEEPDFDVVGHQEPLSDSRVHEETITASSVQETDSSNENSLSFRETVRDFQERIQRDFNAVADIVFPKSMRAPTREALQKAGLFIKREAINVYRFVVRYVKAFIEKRKNQTRDENENAVHTSQDATVVE
eukprot:CAMPEP_0202482898 /NCGR_PEP_ID=MMETSP1361-20130828/2264_1 /ASSEMBLY_ACC=CAM_ASM_000849 /TAXON_ID=210615 /ORGANISM="Staurosira complex sp., Strain CCMP2646" /LENGTH=260 /DNA_ID=CAMNT_0049110977 /DNA_START=117 /DNA_END=899 /DNA_ORIENTATION=-